MNAISSRTIARQLKRHYVLVLALGAFFTILTFLSMRNLFILQSGLSTLEKAGTQQELLLEKNLLLGDKLMALPQPTHAGETQAQLAANLRQLESQFQGFKCLQKQIGSPNGHREVKKIFSFPPHNLETNFQKFSDEMKALTQLPLDQLPRHRSRWQAAKSLAETKLLPSLDKLNQTLGVVHEQQLQWKKTVAAITLLISLLTLFSLGLVLFWRLVFQIQKSTSQLERENRELQALSSIDSLTGLANRRHFDKVLEDEWRRCLREQQPLSLLLIDLDYFKTYNDTYGHQMGDRCLRQVAQILRGEVGRPGDLVARYGGEEMAVILPHTTLSGATTLGLRICERVEKANLEHRGSIASDWVTVSVGVASLYPHEMSRPGLLVTEADQALYEAKTCGRNQVKNMIQVSKDRFIPQV